MKLKIIHLTSILAILTPILYANDVLLSEQVVMKRGVFWPKYQTEGFNFYDGEWYENPYTNTEEMKTEVGLLNLSDEMLAAMMLQWGYNSVEEAEADLPNLGYTLYGAIYEGLAEGWFIQDGLPEPLPTAGTPSLNNIINDPAKLAAFMGTLSQISPGEINHLLANTTLTDGLASNLLTEIVSLNNQNPSYSAAATTLVDEMTSPSGLLHHTRENFNLTGLDLVGIESQGRDFSNIQITGAQLNNPKGRGHLEPPLNYQNSNFSGLNMAGFNPPDQGITLLFVSSPTYAGPNLQGANFSNTQNLDINVLIGAQNINGINLSVTGITREALKSQSISSAMEMFTSSPISEWTETDWDSWAETRIAGVNF